MHANLAEKDSNNIWKENAHVIVKSKACSSFKNFLGNMQWQKLLNSFGIRNYNCPIKPVISYKIIPFIYRPIFYRKLS